VGGTGTIAEFKADLTGVAFQLTRLFLEIFEISAKDGSEIRLVWRPILFGRGIMSNTTPPTIAPFAGYFDHTVVPGDTLSGIAQDVYGNANLWPRIAAANVHTVPDPNLIFPGQVLRIPT
jgi:nucleoid-associated protein YgaU